MEVVLDPKQTADLASLLGAISAQDHLGSGYRDQAGYWASQVGLGLDTDDMQVIAWLLEDVAGSPWMVNPLQQWASAWAMTLREHTHDQEAY